MICPPCREDEHGECADVPRQQNIRYGLIPLGRIADGAWCYCAHRPREDQEELP
jgi:hypothetical protein